MKTMSQSDKLAVLQPETEDCDGCGRRELLQALSAIPLAIGAINVLSGCRIDDPGGNPAVDAAPTGDGPSGTGFEMCGANLCVDLAHPMNLGLNTVGMFRVIQSGTKKIMVARTTSTDFVTISAVCTHTGCTVRYESANTRMKCPCHGSTYALDGTCTMGANGGAGFPSQNNLKKFTNTFDSPTNLLTIMLT